MNHLILGTAGHIDHGKTALVKALTGIDCDTHPEEKRRGITISLGFAHLTLPDGSKIGIVDVPGHRDFIHTMVAGTSGIDMALLVVAADGGVMPQTREHLAIMRLLGIQHGLVALTRIDLVDDETIAMAEEDIRSLVKGTFLEGQPVVPVSSITSEGIEELKHAIVRTAAGVKQKKQSGIFRMYIDRIFTVSGFGTVVTGSAMGGRISKGAELYLLPGEKKVRVRRIERFGDEVHEAVGGDRTSLNLTGLSREEFRRGMMVSDRPLRGSFLLDAEIELLDDSQNIPLWSNAQFLMGTFECTVRMHLIDADILHPGRKGIVQLHFDQTCIAQVQDRFILRRTSNDITLAGGRVIDVSPLHHRRRPVSLIRKLQTMAKGGLSDLITAEIKKHPAGVPLDEIADRLNCSPSEIGEAMKALPDGIISLYDNDDNVWYISNEAYDNLCSRITRILETHHRRNPLDPCGKKVEELQGMLGLDCSTSRRKFIELVLSRLRDEKKLKNVIHTWALAKHDPGAFHAYDNIIDEIDTLLASKGLQPPSESELRKAGLKHGIDENILRQILNLLVERGKVYHIEDAWLHASVVDTIRIRLLEALSKQPQGLTVAQFRDLIAGNRKICLLLYAIFDREGITVRDGDVRRITSKGEELLHGFPASGG